MRSLDPRFLDVVSPVRVALSHGAIDLPIVYRDVEALTAFFPFPVRNAVNALPAGSGLVPVLAWRGHAVLVLACFDYKDSGVGSYGEVAIAILASTRRLPPLVPALIERYLENVGLYVVHLPVTTELAYRAGRELWNYPKFVADICFRTEGDRRVCELSEGGRSILTLSVASRGARHYEARPFRTFTVRDGKLLRTVVPMQSEFRLSRGRGAAVLTTGDHSVGRELAALEPGRFVLEARHVLRMQSILPAADRVWPMPRP
jgi:hypothetical protein